MAGARSPRTRIIGIAADLEVKVGGAAFDGDLQEVVDVHRRLRPGRAGPVQLCPGVVRQPQSPVPAAPVVAERRLVSGIRSVSQPCVSGRLAVDDRRRTDDGCASVIGPLRPLPTTILSIDRIGVISTAVPTKNTSSAR